MAFDSFFADGQAPNAATGNSAKIFLLESMPLKCFQKYWLDDRAKYRCHYLELEIASLRFFSCTVIEIVGGVSGRENFMALLIKILKELNQLHRIAPYHG